MISLEEFVSTKNVSNNDNYINEGFWSNLTKWFDKFFSISDKDFDRYGNFKANGQSIKFKGFMTLYVEGTDSQEKEEEKMLPDLKEKQVCPFCGKEISFINQ